jgi:hypothetical protein
MSVLAFEEFERGRSASNFWGIMVLNALGALAAFGAALVGAMQGQWS